MNTYKDRPVVVRNLFDDETHSLIVRFVNDFVPLIPLASDRNSDSEPARFGRRYANDLPFFTNIHTQLREYASEMFGEAVKPSYNFLSLYDVQGRCPLHLDRPQCRYTIDYLIQQEQTEPWPINVGRQMTDIQTEQTAEKHPTEDSAIQAVIDAQEWTTCLLEPNDAVCYSGTNAWHYRPTPSDGKADLVFFHFVPEKFRGSLN